MEISGQDGGLAEKNGYTPMTEIGHGHRRVWLWGQEETASFPPAPNGGVQVPMILPFLLVTVGCP